MITGFLILLSMLLACAAAGVGLGMVLATFLGGAWSLFAGCMASTLCGFMVAVLVGIAMLEHGEP